MAFFATEAEAGSGANRSSIWPSPLEGRTRGWEWKNPPCLRPGTLSCEGARLIFTGSSWLKRLLRMGRVWPRHLPSHRKLRRAFRSFCLKPVLLRGVAVTLQVKEARVFGQTKCGEKTPASYGFWRRLVPVAQARRTATSNYACKKQKKSEMLSRRSWTARQYESNQQLSSYIKLSPMDSWCCGISVQGNKPLMRDTRFWQCCGCLVTKIVWEDSSSILIT